MQKHIDKTNEILNLLVSSMRVDIQKLIRSGAIDLDAYNPDEYVLAKILVTAAMRRSKNDFQPLLDEHREIVKNLEVV